MLSVPVHHYLVLAALLFAVGAVGVVTRRNALVLFMSVELMLNAANLVFLTFARVHGDANGQVAAFVVMAVAAAEAAVGLSVLLLVFRRRGTVHVDELTRLSG